MTAPAITIYLSDWCSYCRCAKELLVEKKAAFVEINVDEDAKLRDQMVARSHQRTVPQIFIGDRHVGGCDDLITLDQSGELDRLLKGA